MEEKNKNTEKEEEKLVATRGRTFQGYVIKKFDKRIVVEFERIVKIKKFERFTKKKTKLHARIPRKVDVHVGDYVSVRECRPLSKIIHFMLVKVIKRSEEIK